MTEENRRRRKGRAKREKPKVTKETVRDLHPADAEVAGGHSGSKGSYTMSNSKSAPT